MMVLDPDETGMKIRILFSIGFFMRQTISVPFSLFLRTSEEENRNLQILQSGRHCR